LISTLKSLAPREDQSSVGRLEVRLLGMGRLCCREGAIGSVFQIAARMSKAPPTPTPTPTPRPTWLPPEAGELVGDGVAVEVTTTVVGGAEEPADVDEL